ncbi:MAG: type II CAAX endopeptidase family protein [Ferruginibacter sp.]
MILVPQNTNRSAVLRGIIFILLALFLVSLLGTTTVLHFFGLTKINPTLFFFSRILYWISAALLWLYAIKIEKQPLLIWKETKYNLLFYVKIIFTIYLGLFLGLYILKILLSLTGLLSKSDKMSELTVFFLNSKLLLVFTALTAGVIEELIFRGYLLPRFEAIFKNHWIAISISSLLFGLLHYRYGTIVNVAGPVFIGFVFGYFYWRFRNIKILIIAHFLWDIIALLLLINQK